MAAKTPQFTPDQIALVAFPTPVGGTPGHITTLIEAQRTFYSKAELKRSGEAPEKAVVYKQGVTWTTQPGIPYQIPTEVTHGYMSAMLKLSHTQELARLWFSSQLNPILEEFDAQKVKGFGSAKVPTPGWDTIISYFEDLKYHTPNFKASCLPIPDAFLQCSSDKLPELRFISSLLNIGFRLIAENHPMFPRCNDPTTANVQGIAYVDILVAMTLAKFYSRTKAKAANGVKLVIKTRSKPSPFIPVGFTPTAAVKNALAAAVVATPGSAGPEESIDAGPAEHLRFEDSDALPSEDELDMSDPATLEHLERQIHQWEQITNEWRGTVLSEGRAPMSQSLRNELVAKLMKRVTVLNEDWPGTESNDMTHDMVQTYSSQAEAADTLGLPTYNNRSTNLQEDSLLPVLYDSCPTAAVTLNAVRNGSKYNIQIPIPGNPPLSVHPWQITGINWILKMLMSGRSAMLADECGLGKTLQALLSHVFRVHSLTQQQQQAGRPSTVQQTYKPTLIVCPAGLVNNWWNETRRFLPTVPLRIWYSNAAENGKGPISAATLSNKVSDLIQFIDSLDPNDPTTEATLILTTYSTSTSRALLANGNKAYGNTEITVSARDESGEYIKAPGVIYTTDLAQKFNYIICDEAHKIRNEATLTSEFLALCQPKAFLWLTATPIVNNPKDELGYSRLGWNPQWKLPYDVSHNTLYGLEEEEELNGAPSIPDDTPAVLDPDMIRKHIVQGMMPPTKAAHILPKIWRQRQLRRTNQTLVDLVADGSEPPICIGETIPKYNIKTVQLGFDRGTARQYSTDYWILATNLSTVRATEDPKGLNKEGMEGRTNVLAHKRLSAMTVHPNFIKMDEYYARHSDQRSMMVGDANKASHAKDHGVTWWQIRTQLDKSAPVYRDRYSAGLFMGLKSPKLSWTAHQINTEVVPFGKKALIFCQWPQTQVSGFSGSAGLEL